MFFIIRLTLMSNNPLEQHAKFQASVDDENFAVGLINKIIKAFLAATEPKIQVVFFIFDSIFFLSF